MPSLDGGGIAFDKEAGTFGESGATLLKGFNPTNPHVGDAIIATFFWLGSDNVITSVSDHLSSGTAVGNTYTQVDYVTAGGYSMATYVAINVRNFPDGYSDPGGDSILVVQANLSTSVADGGVILSAYSGVNSVSTLALGNHASASGSGSSTTTADPGAITLDGGALAYGVTMSGLAGLTGPSGFTNIGTLSDTSIKGDAEYTVQAGSGSVDPQWTWFFGTQGTWLATVLALNPSQSAWPNEPAGLQLITDNPFNSLTAPGWAYQPLQTTAEITTDTGAPLSPSNVMRMNYPDSFPSGTEPAEDYYIFGNGGGQEYYVGFWWKASNPWQGDSSGINKILFWEDNQPSSASLIVMMNNQAQPAYYLTVTLEFNVAVNGHLANSWGFDSGTVWHTAGNVNGGNYVLTPGNWYRIEVYFKESTSPTSQDGILRYWATKAGDAAPTQVANYTTVNFDGHNFTEANVTPTWGGTRGLKTESDAFWYDHFHISSPTGQ